jgi:hypothetical protein
VTTFNFEASSTKVSNISVWTCEVDDLLVVLGGPLSDDSVGSVVELVSSLN